MSFTDNWFEHIEELCEEYERVLVTEEEFLASINGILNHPHSPLSAINFRIISGQPFGDISFGEARSDEPTYLQPIDQFDSNGSSCRIRAWRKEEEVVGQQGVNYARLIGVLSRLITSFWKPRLRDDKSRLISLHNSETYQIIDNSLPRLAQATGTLYALFCDIDKFKIVNDSFGQSVGDRVILEFASIIYKISSPTAIAIHRSGDEFAVLYPGQDADVVLFLAKSIMQAVAEYDFRLENVDVRVSAGITPLIRGHEAISYKELEARAEKALKPSKEIKHRGKARFESASTVTIPSDSVFSRNTALCIIKSCVSSPRPFESPWLNMISRYCCDLWIKNGGPGTDFNSNVESLIGWIQPELRNNAVRAALPASEESEDFSPTFSAIDITLAAAHGVFRAGMLLKAVSLEGKSLEIFLSEAHPDAAQLRLRPEDITLVRLGDDADQTGTWGLGEFMHSADVEEVSSIDTRRAILIKIGHSKLRIPFSIFAEEIVIDDRPTRGGGLPDFWEATIAKLIARVNTHTNVAAVYVLGRHEHAALSVKKLEDVATWKDNDEQIFYKTGMSISSITGAAERLEGKIHFPPHEEDLVSHLAGVLLGYSELKPDYHPTNLHVERRFFHRDLNMSDLALTASDGCRVNTAAEAFPVVLEIARKFSSDETKVIDQAGQELKELTDFKVHLKTPRRDMIPDFYEGEKVSLEEYFQRQFLSETGLFGSAFQKAQQLEVVLNHLAEAIKDPRHQFSTRRAVLVVPNEIKQGEEFAPLGLISVQIIPRFIQHRIRLKYSYTWRTVEALVGFPYSLYGSIRFSEAVTEKLRALLQPELATELDVGDLSYMAHSLHIFVDEYGQNIARRIVDNASL